MQCTPNIQESGPLCIFTGHIHEGNYSDLSPLAAFIDRTCSRQYASQRTIHIGQTVNASRSSLHRHGWRKHAPSGCLPGAGQVARGLFSSLLPRTFWIRYTCVFSVLRVICLQPFARHEGDKIGRKQLRRSWRKYRQQLLVRKQRRRRFKLDLGV